MLQKRFTLLLTLTLILGLSNTVEAQREFGVVWEVPDTYNEAQYELNKFTNLGIRHIRISRTVNSRLIRDMESDSLLIYPEIPFQFVLPSSLIERDSLYRTRFISLIGDYRNVKNVKAFGLFQFGSTYSPALNTYFSSYINAVNNQSNKSVYYVTAQPIRPNLSDLFDYSIYYYQGQERTKWADYKAYTFDGSLFRSPWEQLGYVLSQTESFPQKPIFFESNWLLETAQPNSEFSMYLRSASSDSIALYPHAANNEADYAANDWIVLILLIVWSIFAIHYSISPLYRRNLFRYFTSHSFFATDIFDWRNRLPNTALILFLQHTLLVGLWIYTWISYFHTSLGTKAVVKHYPILANIASWPFLFFIIGILLALLIQSISIFWLYLPAKKVNRFSQVISLYAWPLQLNLLTISVLIPIAQTHTSLTTWIIISLTFALIWIGSFVVTAIDIGNYLSKFAGVYMAVTAGLFLVCVTLGIISITLYTNIPEVIQLFMNLS